MNWGKGITIVMIAFMAFILSMVVRAFSRDADLIREDYYQHELSFDEEKKAKENFEQLNLEVILQKTDNALLIMIPEMTENFENGKISFYRPDKATWDRTFDLKLNANKSQAINNTEFNPGFYEISIQWSISGTNYFYADEIIF